MSAIIEINGDSTMEQVLMEYPGARRALFRKYHIGGCSSCGFQMDETLGGVCERNNALNVTEVLAEIQASHTAKEEIYIEPKALKAELESAWRQVDEASDLEMAGKEQIAKLRVEIAELTRRCEMAENGEEEEDAEL